MMGGDMVAALGRATVDGLTLFGQNCNRSAAEDQRLRAAPGREFALGESVQTQLIAIPQARQTFSVLAWQPDAWWGYGHGVNEHGVVLGCTSLRNNLTCSEPGLTGGDLVRLALERSHNARQAMDLLTGLVERHGQSAAAGGGLAGGDNGFLIADANEAFAVETAGHHWVCQEIQEVRAASNVCLIRQDWDHISTGLGGHAIAQGWWPADGSKLDFAGTLSADPTGQASGLRRWGRATLLLEQQNGHIDVPFLRRLLSDHYEGTHFEVDPHADLPGPVPLCRHGQGPGKLTTAASAIVQLSANPARLPVIWFAFGPPCTQIYFPLFLEGELPRPFALGREEGEDFSFWRCRARFEEWARTDPEGWERVRDDSVRLQARFDQEAEEMAVEGAALKRQGNRLELQRRASLFMQHHLEQFEATLEDRGMPGRGIVEAESEMVSYF